jgi:hypothetical protein
MAVLSDWHSCVDMQACEPVLALDHWPVAGWYRSALPVVALGRVP